MADLLTVEVTGEEKLERGLRALEGDLKTAIRTAAPALRDEVLLMVRDKYRRKDGWPKRKQSTIDRYAAMNRRGFRVLNEDLRRTDALYQSETTHGGPHSIYRVEDDSLTMGTDLKYAAILQARGWKQYDPEDSHVRRFLAVLKRAQKERIEDRGFEYRDGGEIPF